MGPVAAWSLGIVTINQLITIITTRVTTSAPERAGAMMGLDQFSVAGNATYQNAYTIYILPYSLIAVSAHVLLHRGFSRHAHADYRGVVAFGDHSCRTAHGRPFDGIIVYTPVDERLSHHPTHILCL